MKRTFIVLLMIAFITMSAKAQDLLAPEENIGDVYYIPYPLTINIDGDLADWAGVPVATIDRGPTLSDNPAENGPFTVSVAADNDNLYVSMTITDQTIITDQHGEDYWNEDSLEFYFNLSDNINATSYGNGVFQTRIIPSDIGNTDPTALTLGGVFYTEATVTGFVFETEDGWGFEVSVPLEGRITPEHGLNIGFQAQANGASSADRDLKLIWSNADENDNSWQNPSLFGTAVFYEIGRTDIPETVDRNAPAPPQIIEEKRPLLININQLGYFPNAPKIAAFHHESESPLSWSLLDEHNTQVAKGETQVMPPDTLTGSTVHQIDFTSFNTIGSGYKLAISDLESAEISIDKNIYSSLKQEAFSFFYRSRSGIELLPEFAGESYARAAGHLSDNAVTCYQGIDAQGKTWPGCDYTLDVAGGWYDAGDYGKYVVNGGISVWTLMNSYERNPSAWADGTLPIPEKTNDVPDILDEARWEMEFILAMQVPSGEQAGMAHHKMHDVQWDALPLLPITEQDNDLEHTNPSEGRYLMPPTTSATLNLAATAAQCARIWTEFDPEFSEQCLTAAETAWDAAQKYPDVLAGSVPGTGGGDYGDENISDEFYWAAAELYVTTGKAVYLDYLTQSPNYLYIPTKSAAMYWGDTATLGTISLAMVSNNLPDEDVKDARTNIVNAADEFLAMMDANAYQIPITDFVWGSNSNILNNLIVIGLAYEFTNETVYLDGVTSGLDYLLGRNPVGLSYITGYGTYAAEHPHHRFWANTPDGTFPPPPPGVVVGGPNANIEDPVAQSENLIDLPPAQRYVDDVDSYSTNEVAINWNAPLAWVVSFVDEHKNGITPSRLEAESAPISQLSIVLVIGLGLLLLIGILIFIVRKSR